jgi:peptide/nickel transport system substrate-binding protein
VSRRDGAVILVLVVLLAVLGGTVAAPAFEPAATPTPAPSSAPVMGHSQGVLGRPSSITPLTARTQVDRDLVALLFRGLVRLGSGTTILPDLAERWTVEEKGARWTFHLRTDAFWHDGTPVTSADVAYTVGVLQDRAYEGPLASTWAHVEVTVIDATTVRLDLGDPIGGFLQAATLPLMPAHLLAGVPVGSLADDAFATRPLGNGAFALVDVTAESAVLEPVLAPVVAPTAPLENPAAGAVSARTPRLSRLELRFYDTADELAAALAAGEIGSAGDLLPSAAMAIAADVPGTRALRYPATTLTAITFNLRSTRSPFADQRTRQALLAAVDRADMIRDLLGGAGARADTPIPPSSWAYDAKATTPVAYDRTAAATGLRAAGWKRVDGAWIAPGQSKALAVVLLAPVASASPIVHAAAERVASSWTSLGLATTVEALPPGEFVAKLRALDFQAAIVDVNMGLDPDPYPILGSTQVREGGANVSGIQDPALDAALVAARAPGVVAARKRAYRDLQKLLGTLQPMPTLFFRDSVFVIGDGLVGPATRPISDAGDRFWDVVRWATAGR